MAFMRPSITGSLWWALLCLLIKLITSLEWNPRERLSDWTWKQCQQEICSMHWRKSLIILREYIFFLLDTLSGEVLVWRLISLHISKIHTIQSSITYCAAAAAKSLQSCPTLCDPIDSSSPGPAVPGILQARTLEWVAISSSNAGKWKVKVKSFSRVRLCVTP